MQMVSKRVDTATREHSACGTLEVPLTNETSSFRLHKEGQQGIGSCSIVINTGQAAACTKVCLRTCAPVIQLSIDELFNA
jgi:hypothetical protein